MGAVSVGPIRWGLERDEEGHRTYTIVHEVRFTGTSAGDVDDGPRQVMNATGLPAIGDTWNFFSDTDSWAFCYPDMKVSTWVDRERNRYWEVEQKFSTRPLKRCQTTSIENPLLEPDKVSGSFVKYTKEADTDRFGNAIHNSSFEPIQGPKVEFDHNRPTVRIEQNVSSLDLALVTGMVDTVNDASLWGLGTRRIKLSGFSWEKKWYGVCTAYYTRTFEFDIRYETFDRSILDEGTKALHGEWSRNTAHWVVTDVAPGVPADEDDPSHFIRVKDLNGENMRVILNGHGVPIDSSDYTGTGSVTGAGRIDIEFYSESNFSLLGLPVSL